MEVRRWLARHPRWTFPFTAASSSWLNAIEGFCGTRSRRRLMNGVFGLVAELRTAIGRFVAAHYESPKPSFWRADPDEIIAARPRGSAVVEQPRSR